MTISGLLFPRTADNSYRGQRFALWILGVIALLNGVIGFNSMLNTRSVAMGADGIPLDAFPAEASHMVLLLFALLGATRIVMFALSVVVLVRYRALASLTLALFALGEALSNVVHRMQPTQMAVHAPGSIVMRVIFALTALGLLLSLWERKNAGLSAPHPPG